MTYLDEDPFPNDKGAAPRSLSCRRGRHVIHTNHHHYAAYYHHHSVSGGSASPEKGARYTMKAFSSMTKHMLGVAQVEITASSPCLIPSSSSSSFLTPDEDACPYAIEATDKGQLLDGPSDHS